ncbi:flagellar biosynthesis protein FlhA [Sneathiella chungangensis]|uniref:Flagellar biosynthesis protein FlhA n=1 Tax=Sneathiella chungangensis TaxID=1418234 RepID=A0A845MI69_9PROT|nr:flagellar biosynthesis protein FlhA [Sneathiella chungangensis]MZR23036.1 flagellar biosynthesis protein FlhA [Sneathiella chungangensis]
MSETQSTAEASRGGNELLHRFTQIVGRSDIGLALGVVCILIVLILPMPSWLLDFSLAISITFSVVILMTCLFISKPLDFSSFPTVLLIATMLRLALNLASTRLILSEGHTGPEAAGHVIEAFGSFVMGGNFVIGIIVFSILVLVNFVVITKGSGRIAEVAARFSLDAMPGKQMAIDADLSAGMINEDTARKRRKDLEDESGFFGAMDGASKFVRGDAIAGLLITFINIIGGIIIGVAQEGMTFAAAADSYTLLTVGDGLVSQVPALIVSVAAGLLVSRGGVIGTTDKALLGQLGGYPRALGVSSFLLVGLSLLPGVPMIPFMILAGGIGYSAFVLNRRQETKLVEEEQLKLESKKAAVPAEEPISSALAIDDLRLELGYGLLSLINDTEGYRLTDQIKALRRQIASEMGFVMPSVRILDNMQLPANNYLVRVKEVEAGAGDVRPNNLLIMDPQGQHIDLPGEETVEPTFGLPAVWVDTGQREEASFRGYTIVDPATVITTHLTEILKDHMPDLLSYAETQKLLDDLPSVNQKLIADLIPSHISVSGVQRILQNLLSERVSIRDLPTILEGISEATGYSQNINIITEHVRARLSRQISAVNTADDGYIPLITLSPQWEQNFANAIIGQGDDRQLSMAPSQLQEFIARVRDVFDTLANQGHNPVMLTSPAIRPYVRSIIERFRPSTVVMSQNEIHPKARLKTLAQV